MSESTQRSVNPKSIRHMQILDIAADNPDAPLADIAAEVPSATTDLVESVLDKYGDPADNSSVDTSTVLPMANESASIDPGELTGKQRETLRVIHDNPTATQREIADELGVSTATVSNRVNAIDDFDWSDRQVFTTAIFDDTPSADTDTPVEQPQGNPNDDTREPEENTMPAATDTMDDSADESTDTQLESELVTALDSVEDRLTAIETRLEANHREPISDSAITDPELVHKIVHACLQSEQISEDEELQILRELLA